MQNYSENNWSAYQERYGKDESSLGDANGSKKIEVLPSRSGVPTLRAGEAGEPLVFLHSSIDPVREATRIAEGLTVKPGELLFVSGFGLGYLIEALLERIDEKIPIFVVEPDVALFKIAMQVRDLRHVLSSERVYLVVQEDPEDVKPYFSIYYDTTIYHNLQYAGLPGYQTVYNTYFSNIDKALKDVLNSKIINIVTIMKLGTELMENSILNVLDYCKRPGVAELFDRFTNVPAIIVSAGPSLDKNVQLLHEAKGKAIILAVGTAVKALKKHGITPDFIVSIDPHPLNYEHFKGVDTTGAALISEIQSNRMILENFKGPVFVSGGMPVLNWFDDIVEEKGTTESGGSVANNAFSAAYKMGADPIVFVGQDLAYSEEGRSHASGTNYEKNALGDVGDSALFFKVKANNGGKILTSRSFYQFLLFFETWIRKKADRTYINATEGGAYIKGTEVKTLREVIDTYCKTTVDVQAVIDETQGRFKPPSLTPIMEIIEQRHEDAKNAIKKADKAMKHLKKLEIACQKRQGDKIQRHLRVVKEIYEEFHNDNQIRNLAEWFVHHDIYQVMYRTYKAGYDNDDDFHKVIDDYVIFYMKIKEGTEIVKGLIENLLEQGKKA